MILDALSNVTYRVSLHGPGAELEGSSKKKKPARRGLTRAALEGG